MKILVINCGSSSLKYEVYQMPEQISLGKGQVERIGLEDSFLNQERGSETFHLDKPAPTHTEAFAMMIDALLNSNCKLIDSPEEISGVGHRVVHGGEDYAQSVIIDDKVIKAIEDNIALAPLHNPANLIGIRQSMNIFKDVPQVAVFDTSFHQTMSPSAYLYGLPRELYDKYRIRRYGFHGTSHRYVSNVALQLTKRSAENTSMITCHLGNGASITAIQNGVSFDTSMGFTPLEGLIMGTRSGDIDPSILFYLEERGYSMKDLNIMLNKKSGLLGLSGISSDLRDLEAAAEAGNANAIQALDAFAHRVKKYIGAYAACMVKVDLLIFTGGIGENGVNMRNRICNRLENIGIHISPELNQEVGSQPGVISKAYSPVTILVIPTNEELQIAMDTHELVSVS